MTNLHRHNDLQCPTVLANRRQDDDSSLIPWKLHQQLLVANGIAAAIRHFKTKEEYSQIDLKESTMRGWKKLYCDTLSSKSRMGDDKPVKELPAESAGRTLLLGEDVEEKRTLHISAISGSSKERIEITTQPTSSGTT